MSKIYKGLPYLLLFVIAGCGTFKAPWHPNNISQHMESYKLNEQLSTSVGSVMVSARTVGGYYEPSGLGVIAWGRRDITIFDKGSSDDRRKWVAKYLFDGVDGDYILVSDAYFQGTVGIIVKSDGTVPINPAMRIDKRGSVRRYPIVLPTSSNEAFSPKGGFKFELIYSGTTDQKINITYREYVDDFARNAFYQDVTYDLNKSKIIHFKSLVIEVIKATNSEIIFKVLEDNNLEWMP